MDNKYQHISFWYSRCTTRVRIRLRRWILWKQRSSGNWILPRNKWVQFIVIIIPKQTNVTSLIAIHCIFC